MARKYLGVGWGFPITFGENGDIALAEFEERIAQSIWIILSTTRGERVMRPDFGSGLYELVFSTGDANTMGTIVAEVRDALLRWETRIDVRDVTVHPDDGNESGSMLLINIEYEIRTTNTVFNLVYPFYLDTGVNV